jgi:hypothetical protein
VASAAERHGTLAANIMNYEAGEEVMQDRHPSSHPPSHEFARDANATSVLYQEAENDRPID